ncbi:hypothetical protein LEP1GSC040_3286 [Leptospira santarosai str. 2000030832]|nr:hypothetical protein LEP1GSC040_3286 [Leptospira santarosai str. 2000030832]
MDLSHEKFLIYLPNEWIYWSWKVAKQFFHFAPLLAIPLLYDFYGHKTDPVPFEKKENPRYYPILILGLLIAAIGSFVPGFREFYPRAVEQRTTFISRDLVYDLGF